jgi:hypothetical protein
MTTHREWPAWVLIAILASVVANNAFDYSVLVPQQPLRYQMHDAIVAGTAPAPQRYRTLVPRMLDPIIRAASAAMPADLAFRRTYLAFHFLALIALLAGVYAYSRQWFTRDQSLIGALIVASTLHLALRMGEYWDFSPIPADSVFAPWSLLEPTLVALGLIAIRKRRWMGLTIIVLVAGLNSGAAAAVAGIGPPPVTFEQNLAHLPSTAINLGLFMGPAILLTIAGFSQAPLFARRALLAATPLVVAVALFGYWWEIRLLMPLYPILAPIILSSLFVPRTD